MKGFHVSGEEGCIVGDQCDVGYDSFVHVAITLWASQGCEFWKCNCWQDCQEQLLVWDTLETYNEDQCPTQVSRRGMQQNDGGSVFFNPVRLPGGDGVWADIFLVRRRQPGEARHWGITRTGTRGLSRIEGEKADGCGWPGVIRWSGERVELRACSCRFCMSDCYVVIESSLF